MSKKLDEKKSPNVLVTILCIALIIAMFFVGWFAGGKTYELENKIVENVSEKEDNKKEEKDIELVALRDDLIDKVGDLERLGLSSNNVVYMTGSIYSSDITSVDISDELKLYNVLQGLYGELVRRSPVTTNYNFGSLEIYIDSMTQIDVSLVESEYKKLYGNTTINHKGFDSKCPMFIYDSVNKKYYGDAQCGGTSSAGVLPYVNRVTTMGNEAYVYVSLGTWQESNVYTDFERTKLYKSNVIDHNNIVNESNYQDFSQYKYTFVNEDGNYIFKSLNKIK